VSKRMKRVGLLSLVAASMASMFVQSSAMASSDAENLAALLKRYFAVVSDRDMTKLETLWINDPSVVLVFPSDKQAAVGWEGVKKSYQARFDSVSDWKLSEKEPPHIQVRPGSAITTTPVLIQATAKSGAAVSYTLLFTQVFVQRDHQWLLVASHGSRVPD
jgi:ketosteroid isomerase-like protein